MYRYNCILFVDFFINYVLYMGFIANAIKRIPEIDTMLDFTFPLQLKGTCLPQKNCFSLDLVYYMVGIA